MLINFTLENWMSFRDPTTFTMVPGNDDNHNERISDINSIALNLLPIAAIFGGNASGKSNFVSALNFVREFVLEGTNNGELIQVEPFLLDEKCDERPTNFQFELLIENTIFLYDFSATSQIVVSESLSEIKNKNKNLIYKIFNDKIEMKKDYEHEQIFDILFENRKRDQLFLTTICTLSRIELPVYKWFKNNLLVVFPSTKIKPYFLFSSKGYLDRVNDLLMTLDCGVSKLIFEDYQLSDEDKADYEKQLKKNSFIENRENLTVTFKEGDEIFAKKMMSFHENNQNKSIRFGVEKESNGTIRLLDLLPIFIMLSQPNSKRVFVIDEIDQSIHSKMLLNLIEAFSDNCDSDTRSQLIFTTHNALLMDNYYLRNDEMWLTDRDNSGNSRLYSIGEYEGIHPNMNIRENYMIGRFKGVPDMLLIGSQLSKPLNEEVEE